MSHPHELLLAYIDGELAEPDERRVEEHLASCASCTEEVDTLLAARTAVLSRERREPPPGFAERVAARTAPTRGANGRDRAGWRNLSDSRIAAAAALWLVSVLGAGAIGVCSAPRALAATATPPPSRGSTATQPIAATTDSAQYLLVLFEADTMWPPRPGSQRTGYSEWYRKLASEGRVVASEKLTDERGAIVAPSGRLIAVSDDAGARSPVPAGPLVSGFFIVRAGDDTAAVAIARESPHLRYGGSILVRRIE